MEVQCFLRSHKSRKKRKIHVPYDEIRCINKSDRPNPHERMSVGGRNLDGTAWKLSQQEAVQGNLRRRVELLCQAGGLILDVVVATSRFGNDYLKTQADGEVPDNLLRLPECR